MAESAIEWTEQTWNPIVGCSVVSPGCTNCYAMKMAARLDRMGQDRYRGLTRPSKAGAVWTGEMRIVDEALILPLRRRKPTTWFVNSMSDLFHESVPDEWIDQVFTVMRLAPQHTFQVLTKRSDRMRAYLAQFEQRGRYVVSTTRPQIGPDPRDGNRLLLLDEGQRWPLPNVWLGVSTEDQRRADERVPDLLATPAAVRFVSAEPLLGPIDFTGLCPRPVFASAPRAGLHIDALRGRETDRGPWLHPRAAPAVNGGARLDWIIVGGESGPGARPMHPDWARQIRDACAAAGVAYLFKQWGAYQHGSTMGRASSLDRIVFNDGRMLTDVTKPACKSEDRENGWQGRAPEMMALVGKKAAGRLLDGVEHNGFPEVSRG